MGGQSRPLSLAYAGELLQIGVLKKQQHDIFIKALSKDIVDSRTATNGDHALTVTIPGHVTLRRTVCRAELESTHQVLNTPELLACILAHVPVKDLVFRATLVCSAFRNVIKQSPELKRRLFKAPDGDTAGAIPKYVHFPLKVKGFAFGNPGTGRAPRFLHRYLGLADLYLEIKTGSMTQETRKSTAFRESHITQPPSKHLVLASTHDFESRISPHVPDADIHDENGITFGRVLDFIEQVEGNPNSRLFRYCARFRRGPKLNMRFELCQGLKNPPGRQTSEGFY